MRQIKLYGQFIYMPCYISDEDFDEINPWIWHGVPKGNTVYAATNCWYDGKKTTMYMHRLILGLSFGDPRMGDHEDGNGWNNQRWNLRIATNQQNSFNRKPQLNKTSKYKGVSWYKRDSKWRAEIKLDGKKYHLGLYDHEIEAAIAYDETAKDLFREFANVNFKE